MTYRREDTTSRREEIASWREEMEFHREEATSHRVVVRLVKRNPTIQDWGFERALNQGLYNGRHFGSQAKFTMRSETRELQRGVVIRFPVNQYQVGLDVASPMVLPITGKRMIAMLMGQWFIVGEDPDNPSEIIHEEDPVRAFGLTLQVAFELRRLFNLFISRSALQMDQVLTDLY
uniref:Uncharacterized protein n=1 Tax=Candidatus Kentrum sp. SD TaxID=2126332 RepID=A0A450YCC7_9GAMM|nr:MAG: hypothetical protein BECKSD772E_GA0070983_100238 [Candidatus Kentron sp. SD]